MYEHAHIREAAQDFTSECVEIEMKPDWTIGQCVRVIHEDGSESQLRVHWSLERAVRRAAALQAMNLCTRVDIVATEYEDTGLTITSVYWED